MLKEKNDGKIETIKLVSGEEIIAKVVKTTDKHMVVSTPLLMVLSEMPGAPNQTQVVFTPWMMALSDNEEAKLSLMHIICHAPARKDAATQYESATRS